VAIIRNDMEKEEYKNPLDGEVARLSHKHIMRLSEASSSRDKADATGIRGWNEGLLAVGRNGLEE